MSTRDQILQFLRNPRAFSAGRSEQSRDLWLRGLREFAEPQIKERQDMPLRTAQVAAWEGIADHRSALVLGPPGTGKTFALSWMAIGYVQARTAANLATRILVTGFTLNSIGNLLDSIHSKALRYLVPTPDVLFLGSEPAAGLTTGIQVQAASNTGLRQTWQALSTPQVILGCSVWSLYKLIATGPPSSTEGSTAPLFDLVLIDEASQMVVGHGLLALAGLAPDGRVLVAGDNKQLSPIRESLEYKIDGRDLGGSLYDFLKSANIPEFPLDETFRLNAPLTLFPEQRFYPGTYRAAPEISLARLALRNSWEQGLADWERIALDPEYPICIILHDGPVAGTHNPFEQGLAIRLAALLWERMLPDEGQATLTPESFWQHRLAIISPHRAQNIAIRAALESKDYGRDCAVETVDRIQGKEREAIIASYTVADSEFALVEGEFIFSPERLNVTITRAKTKLLFIISRKLLDAIPSDEDVFDAAQTLREFVFSTEHVGELNLQDAQGHSWPVAIRVRRFNSDAPLPTLSSQENFVAQPPPQLSAQLKELLAAIQTVAARSPYHSAADFELKKELYSKPQLSDLVDLMRLGMITLGQRTSASGPFWVATPLDPRRLPFSADRETVRKRIDEAIEGARKSSLSPFYTTVRDRFVWTDQSGSDLLFPVIDAMVTEGELAWGEANGSKTIDLAATIEPVSAPEPPREQLEDRDFQLLNLLEDIEARRINFGVYESWVTVRELSTLTGLSHEAITDSARRLKLHGHLFEGFADRIRSRVSELAREVRYVKQRFSKGDSARRPYLVRAIKLEIKDREKPTRNVSLARTLQSIKDAAGQDRRVSLLLDQLGLALRKQWGADDPLLAGFQQRALEQVTLSWLGHSRQDAFVITADTGSGKTEAACLPLIVGAGHDYLAGIQGTRAIFVYPRIRLGANQAQRMAGYLAALCEFGFPDLTLGIQNAQVPRRLLNNSYLDEELWRKTETGALTFPFFGCPSCGADLVILPESGIDGADELRCIACGWRFRSWIGSKDAIRRAPPSIFLVVTESLHQWMHDPQYAALFGDGVRQGPRALVADEVHLYSHTHGAEVGYALRRLLARAESSGNSSAIAVGMSATLSEASRVWGVLCGRTEIVELTPEKQERRPNLRGREYFFFIQPEVESRGRDVAGAATTIQSLMCIAHGMRRRIGRQGGYRGIVFLDSVDKLKRLHSDYQDAEEQKVLAKYRTYLFDDDPGSNEPRTTCCGEPTTCDRFREGECWFFAANDAAQWTAKGPYRRGRSLTVGKQPIFSGSTGKVESVIRNSDLVFATSTLEVGYDDPDMTLVYQHYAPRNVASFVQRKGRGGRGEDDRPITAVTLSVYSARDSWYFRRPRQMFESTEFEIPLNLDNVFVIRGQVLAAVLDAVSMWVGSHPGESFLSSSHLEFNESVLEFADKFVQQVFGSAVYTRLEVADLPEFLKAALGKATDPIIQTDSLRQWREKIPWIPATLFESVNLPALDVRYKDDKNEDAHRSEDIMLALSACAPGNMTRRYGLRTVHWVTPVHGKSPFLSLADYARAVKYPLEEVVPGGKNGFLNELPTDIRQGLGPDIHSEIYRPTSVELAVAGRMDGAGWVSFWGYEKSKNRVRPMDQNSSGLLRISNKSRSGFRRFLLLRTDSTKAQCHDVATLGRCSQKLESFVGGVSEGLHTGLKATNVFWGADVDLRLEDPKEQAAPITQLFGHPETQSLLLHGYQVETEGISLHLNSEYLSSFVAGEVANLNGTEEGRWLKGRFFRYLLESRSIAAGINAYEAQRAAELIVSAAGLAELKKDLVSILTRWDSAKLSRLLARAFELVLQQHPLLTPRRVTHIAESLSTPTFRKILSESMSAVQSEERFRDYVHSLILHGLAIRMKQLFVLFGRGDDDRAMFHVKLPIQFEGPPINIIHVFENGEQGDGTTRSFLRHRDAAFETWKRGCLAECPNALEDAIVERIFEREDVHSSWKQLDPRDERDMDKLAASLGLTDEDRKTSLQTITRVLYGYEAINTERFEFYDLHREIRAVDAVLRLQMSRPPTVWELVSATVRFAKESSASTPLLARLLDFYRKLEDAGKTDSLSPESRLADQVYRLSANLCIDGCPACLHAGSDLMTDSLVEVTVSRRMLERFSAIL